MKKKIFLGIAIVLIACAAVLGGFFASRALVGKQANVDWYEEEETVFSIKTADDLFDLAKLSEKTDLKGKTFKLEADIVINEGNATDWADSAPERKWYPIKNFAGTFDGQGHTISGLYGEIYDKAMGLFVDTKAGAVIRDFKLVNTYYKVEGSPGTAAIAGGTKNAGTFEKIYTDAIIDCDGNFTGGIISSTAGETKLSECWFDGSILRYYYNYTGGGMIAQMNGSTVTVEHCLNTGSIANDVAKNYTRVGGICGVVAGSGTLIVNDSLSAGDITVKTKSQVGSIIGLVGTSSGATFRTVFATKESYGAAVGNGDERVKGGAIQFAEEHLIGNGGYRWTNLDFENYWTIVEGGTPELGYFADEKVSTAGLEKIYDTSWYTGKDTEYVLTNREEMYGFAILSASEDFTGITVKLGANITINEGKAADWAKAAPSNFWIPIMNFSGTFDGQGHTLSGIYLSGSGAMGLFQKTVLGSVVKNLRLVNSYYVNTSSATAYTGSIAGIGGGEFNTIYSNAILTSSGVGVGGIAGGLTIGIPKITNCWYDGKISLLEETGYSAGGMAGDVMTAATIEHCLNTSEMTAERTTNYTRVGGFVGVVGTSSVVGIKDCLNASKITCYEKQAGSILGFIGTSSGATLDTVCSTLDSYSATIGQGSERVVGLPTLYDRSDLLGYSGYQWTNLDFTNYWAAVADSTPILKSFASSPLRTAGMQKKFDTSWYDSSKKTFTLTDAQDLYGLSMIAGTGETFEGKTILLGANIVVNAGDASTWKDTPPSDSWIPAANFCGTFDGQGHSVSGLYKSGGTNIGLFASTGEKAVIKNLIVENSYFANTTATGDVCIGGVVAQGGGTLDTIYSDVIIECSGVGVGGIAGSIEKADSVVRNCWYAGSISLLGQNGYTAGGIIGTVRKDTTLENCLNSGSIQAERTVNYTRIGGLVGLITGATATFKGTLSVGEISSITKQAGSILGFYGASAKAAFATNVYAATESFSATIGQGTGTISGAVTRISTANLLGDKAKTNASGLDYGKYWTTLSKRTPVLTSFVSKAPALVTRGMVPDTSWYNTTSKEFKLSTPEQLYGLAELSYENDFAGIVIKLENDITVNSGDASVWRTSAPQYVWEPIQKFAGTFDGQGNTISGLYNADGKNVGLFGETTETSVIRDFKLVNSYFANMDTTGEVNIGSIVGQGGGQIDTVYTDAIIETTGNTIGGIIGSVNIVSNKNIITNCWFAGKLILSGKEANTVGGIAGTVGTADVQGSLVMKNCLVDNESDEVQILSTGRTTAYLRIGGLCGIVRNGSSKLTLDSCLVAGNIQSDVVNNSGSIIGYLTTNLEYTGNVYVLSSCYSKQIGNTGSSAKTTNNGGSLQVVSSTNSMLGWNATMTASTLDFEDIWVPIEEDTPVLKSFVGDRPVAKEPEAEESNWYNPEGKEFKISSAEQLFELAELSNFYDFKGQIFTLEKDIIVNELKEGESAKDWLDASKAPEKVWTPIGFQKPFAGTFNGNGKSIIGLYVNGGTHAGLFAKTTADSVIIDVKVLDSCFVNYSASDEVNFGGIVGQGGGKIEKVYTNAIVATSGNTIGGIIGSVNIISEKNIVTNCWFAGELILKGANANTAGGIAGTVGTANEEGTLTIENCLVDNESTEAQITSTGRTGTAYIRIGGICGIVRYGSSELTISSCLVAGKIQSGNATQTGSFIGYVTTKVTYTGDVYVLGSSYSKQLAQTGTNAVVTNKGGSLQTISNTSDMLGWKATKTAATLDFENTWVPIKDDTPVLKYFVGDREVAEKSDEEEPEEPGGEETSWYDPKGEKFTLSTADQLFELAELSKTYDFKGQTFTLEKDIVVNELKAGESARDWLDPSKAPEKAWTPIGSEKPFAGTFDGNGKSISGLYVNGQVNVGLFAKTTEDSVITNVKVLDSCFRNYEDGKTKDLEVNLGSIVGQGGGRIEKVYTNAILATNEDVIGGIIGSVNIVSDKNIVTNCWFAGELILEGAQAHTAGGIVGTVGTVAKETGSITVENCLVDNNADTPQFTSTGRTGGNYLRIGGICGIVRNLPSEIKISHCLVAGVISSAGANNMGVIFGYPAANLTFTGDVYYLAKCHPSAPAYASKSASSTLTGGEYAKKIADESLLYQDQIAENAPGLSNNSLWTAFADRTPVLKDFAEYKTVSLNSEIGTKLHAVSSQVAIMAIKSLKNQVTRVNLSIVK